jgi:tetratricopeptide (TPR) repeat protein
MPRPIAIILMSVILCVTAPVCSEPSQDREQAMDILGSAYTKLQQGDPTAIDGIERALGIDPNLAYANIIRGELAMASEDWEKARMYFHKGLKHLHEPDQPLSPALSITTTAEEVEADTCVFLGYTYIQLAQVANAQGLRQLESKYLDSAKANLQKAIDLNPRPEAKEMAERLLADC